MEETIKSSKDFYNPKVCFVRNDSHNLIKRENKYLKEVFLHLLAVVFDWFKNSIDE